MRLIDADALIESVCHTADLGGWIGDTLRQIKRLAVRYINSAPSIDIVRCGECKYWVDKCHVVYAYDMCIRYARPTDADDYCSYGERNSSEIPTGSERSSE